MGLFKSRNAPAAFETDKAEMNSVSATSIIHIDHAANIRARADAYHGPDEGDIVGPALLRQSALLTRRREFETELDTYDVRHTILEGKTARPARTPGSYHAATVEPENNRTEGIPDLIGRERGEARDRFKALSVMVPALLLACLISAVEIGLLSEILAFGMPEMAGEETVSTGLLALAFLSVVAGSWFALEHAGERVKAMLDRVGAGAVLLYLLGAGTALGLKGSGLIGTFGSTLSGDEDWGSADGSFVERAAGSLVDLIGSAGLAVALAMITVLSLIGIHHLLRIGIRQADIYLTASMAASRADALEAAMTEIATGQLRLARAIEDINVDLLSLSRDVAVEINAIAAPCLARAEERLAQMRIVEDSRPDGFDIAAFEARVTAFREEISIARLQAVIERALRSSTLH